MKFELKTRIISFFYSFLCSFIVFFHFKNQLIFNMIEPLINFMSMSKSNSLFFNSVFELFVFEVTDIIFIEVFVCFVFSIIVISPLFFFEIFLFLFPGYSFKELLFIFTNIFIFFIFFFFGLYISTSYLIPQIWSFFSNIIIDSQNEKMPYFIKFTPSIIKYINFYCYFVFITIIVFIMPFIFYIFIYFNRISMGMIVSYRPFFIFSFILILTLFSVLDPILFIFFISGFILIYEFFVFFWLFVCRAIN